MIRMMAVSCPAVGVLGLVVGGFIYPRETHDAKLGPLGISVSEKQRVNVPMWAGAALVIAGGGLLLVRKEGK